MKKIAILLAATMAFAINSNAQSMCNLAIKAMLTQVILLVSVTMTLVVLKSTQHMAIK